MCDDCLAVGFIVFLLTSVVVGFGIAMYNTGFDGGADYVQNQAITLGYGEEVLTGAGKEFKWISPEEFIERKQKSTLTDNDKK